MPYFSRYRHRAKAGSRCLRAGNRGRRCGYIPVAHFRVEIFLAKSCECRLQRCLRMPFAKQHITLGAPLYTPPVVQHMPGIGIGFHRRPGSVHLVLQRRVVGYILQHAHDTEIVFGVEFERFSHGVCRTVIFAGQFFSQQCSIRLPQTVQIALR